MSSSDIAAWTQAIAAVITIVTTAYLSRRDASDRRVEAEARARSAAIAILPPMTAELEALTWAVNQLADGCRIGRIGNDGPYDEDAIALWHTDTLTPALEAVRPLLHELRGAAEPVQRAYFSLSELQSAYLDFVKSADDGGPHFTWMWTPEMEAKIVSKTRDALECCQLAVDALHNCLRASGRKSWFARMYGR